MKVKRYFAVDMRTALAQVREQQGPDVLILSNRKVDGGVELVTAVDAVPEPAAAAPARRQVPARVEPVVDALWTGDAMLKEMQTELLSLRRLVEGQMAGLAWGELGRRQPLRAATLRRLVALGISPRLAREVSEAVQDCRTDRDAWHRALAVVARRLTLAGDRILAEGGTWALVGATGVGKTTLIAKLATRRVLSHGADSVGLICTDSRRIGAHDQLRSFARILGVPMSVAAAPDELAAALHQHAGRDLVLIDTPGLGLAEGQAAGLAALLAPAAPALRTALVLAAPTDARVLESAAQGAAALAPAAAIVTKLDETHRPGPVLSVAIERTLPLMYMSAGQRIPEDLEVVTAAGLVARAARGALAGSADADDALIEQAFAEEAASAVH
ncbi:MAG: flagellar biosynthesis protein FlhF [Gammaproteobacteria bacterium]